MGRKVSNHGVQWMFNAVHALASGSQPQLYTAIAHSVTVLEWQSVTCPMTQHVGHRHSHWDNCALGTGNPKQLQQFIQYLAM